MSFSKTKIIASIAVVGTVAAVVALTGFNSNQSSAKLGNRLLQAALDASDKSAEDVAAF